MSHAINQYFDSIKIEKKHDEKYINILSNSFTNNEDGDETVEEVMKTINSEYVKSKENQD